MLKVKKENRVGSERGANNIVQSKEFRKFVDLMNDSVKLQNSSEISKYALRDLTVDNIHSKFRKVN